MMTSFTSQGKLLLLFSVILYVALFTYYYWKVQQQDEKSGMPLICSKTIGNITVGNKIISLWGDFFGIDLKPNFTEMKCREQRCLFTRDVKLLNVSDVVIIHWAQASYKDLPNSKKQPQKWVALTFEPPYYLDYMTSKVLNPLIDWTVSYKHDSDIPAPYGRFEPRPPNVPVPEVPSPEELSQRLPVAWMRSRCKTKGLRENFGEDLKKYIRIDEYGSCSGNLALKKFTIDEGFQYLTEKYVFYLSFESGFCKDYVTEKSYIPLYYGLIPVVYGGGNYAKQLPPGSFVDTLDFPNSSQLAAHLLRVTQNWTLYKSYFEWRKDLVVAERESGFLFLCNLCYRMHNDDGTVSQRDLTQWWSKDIDCVFPTNGKLEISGPVVRSAKKRWYS